MSPMHLEDMLCDSRERIAAAPAKARTVTTHHEFLKLAHAGLTIRGEAEKLAIARKLGVTDKIVGIEFPKMARLVAVIAKEGWQP